MTDGVDDACVMSGVAVMIGAPGAVPGSARDGVRGGCADVEPDVEPGVEPGVESGVGGVMGQDDTRYDQWNLGVTLGQERSQNAVQKLPEYLLDVREDATWPGLAGSGSIRLLPEEVSDLSNGLAQRAKATESLPQRLAAATSVQYGPSTWREANNLGEAGRLVREAVDADRKILGEWARDSSRRSVAEPGSWLWR